MNDSNAFGDQISTLFDLVTDIMTRAEKYRARITTNDNVNTERVREVDDHIIELRELRNFIQTWSDEDTNETGEYVPASEYDPVDLEERIDFLATEYADEYQYLSADITIEEDHLDEPADYLTSPDILDIKVSARWVLDIDRLRDDIKDGEVIEVNLANRSTPGYVYTISDHGNISLYRVELKEVW